MTQLAIVDHSGFGHTDDSPEVTPKAGDRATAVSLGKRVASAAARWRAGAREAVAAA